MRSVIDPCYPYHPKQGKCYKLTKRLLPTVFRDLKLYPIYGSLMLSILLPCLESLDFVSFSPRHSDWSEF